MTDTPDTSREAIEKLLEALDIAEVRAAAWLDRNANQITGMPHGLALSELDMAIDPLRRCVLAVRALRKLDLRALLTERETRGWQPMETAPKDKRTVLLWWPHWSDEPITGFWKHDRWLADRAICDTDDDPGPLAWCPLPPRPKEGA